MKKKILLLSMCGVLSLTSDVSGVRVLKSVGGFAKKVAGAAVGAIVRYPRAALVTGALVVGTAKLVKNRELRDTQNLEEIQKMLQDPSYIDLSSLTGLIGKLSKSGVKRAWAIMATPNERGYTPLHCFLGGSTADSKEQFKVMMQLFIKKGISVTEVWGRLIAPSPTRYTPLLFLAIRCKNVWFKGFLEVFKQIPADKILRGLTAPGEYGFTVLYWLVENCKDKASCDALFDICESLLQENPQLKDELIKELKALKLYGTAKVNIDYIISELQKPKAAQQAPQGQVETQVEALH